ncbi:MAG: hypothetical protein ABIA47_03545 [bacterium]
MEVYIDLDLVIYNWVPMLQGAIEELVRRGHSLDLINVAIAECNKEGFTFELLLERLHVQYSEAGELAEMFKAILANGRQFVFPGMEEVIAEAAALHTLNLLSFGHPEFQMMKWAGLKYLHGYFATSRFVVQGGETKGDIIRRLTSQHRDVCFVDDSSDQLMDVLIKAPWARSVRPMWTGLGLDPHVFDRREWVVVKSPEELGEWIRNLNKEEGDNGR